MGKNELSVTPFPLRRQLSSILSVEFLQGSSSLVLNSGKVIAVGPGLLTKDGMHVPVSVKEGDTVLLPEYEGTEVKLGDKECYLFQDEDILGTLHD